MEKDTNSHKRKPKSEYTRWNWVGWWIGAILVGLVVVALLIAVLYVALAEWEFTLFALGVAGWILFLLERDRRLGNIGTDKDARENRRRYDAAKDTGRLELLDEVREDGWIPEELYIELRRRYVPEELYRIPERTFEIFGGYDEQEYEQKQGGADSR